jgi:hypothetical protein
VAVFSPSHGFQLFENGFINGKLASLWVSMLAGDLSPKRRTSPWINTNLFSAGSWSWLFSYLADDPGYMNKNKEQAILKNSKTGQASRQT